MHTISAHNKHELVTSIRESTFVDHLLKQNSEGGSNFDAAEARLIFKYLVEMQRLSGEENPAPQAIDTTTIRCAVRIYDDAYEWWQEHSENVDNCVIENLLREEMGEELDTPNTEDESAAATYIDQNAISVTWEMLKEAGDGLEDLYKDPESGRAIIDSSL